MKTSDFFSGGNYININFRLFIYIYIYIYISSVVASAVQTILDKRNMFFTNVLTDHTKSNMRRMQIQAFPFSKVAPTALGPS